MQGAMKRIRGPSVDLLEAASMKQRVERAEDVGALTSAAAAGVQRRSSEFEDSAFPVYRSEVMVEEGALEFSGHVDDDLAESQWMSSMKTVASEVGTARSSASTADHSVADSRRTEEDGMRSLAAGRPAVPSFDEVAHKFCPCVARIEKSPADTVQMFRGALSDLHADARLVFCESTKLPTWQLEVEMNGCVPPSAMIVEFFVDTEKRTVATARRLYGGEAEVFEVFDLVVATIQPAPPAQATFGFSFSGWGLTPGAGEGVAEADAGSTEDLGPEVSDLQERIEDMLNLSENGWGLEDGTDASIRVGAIEWLAGVAHIETAKQVLISIDAPRRLGAIVTNSAGTFEMRHAAFVCLLTVASSESASCGALVQDAAERAPEIASLVPMVLLDSALKAETAVASA